MLIRDRNVPAPLVLVRIMIGRGEGSFGGSGGVLGLRGIVG